MEDGGESREDGVEGSLLVDYRSVSGTPCLILLNLPMVGFFRHFVYYYSLYVSLVKIHQEFTFLPKEKEVRKASIKNCLPEEPYTFKSLPSFSRYIP